jgi:hypothetical protein
MIPDSTREAQVLRETRDAAARLIAAVSDRARTQSDATPEEDVAALSAFAGHELEAFAANMLSSLIAATGGALDASDAAWVQRHFHACLGEVGTALREAIDVSAIRHAVAQTLQRKVFEAELNLCVALAPGSDRSRTVEAPPR